MLVRLFPVRAIIFSSTVWCRFGVAERRIVLVLSTILFVVLWIW